MLAAAKKNKIMSVRLPKNLHAALRIKSFQLSSNIFAETDLAIENFLKNPKKVEYSDGQKSEYKFLLITQKSLNKLSKISKRWGTSVQNVMGMVITEYLKKNTKC